MIKTTNMAKKRLIPLTSKQMDLRSSFRNDKTNQFEFIYKNQTLKIDKNSLKDFIDIILETALSNNIITYKEIKQKLKNKENAPIFYTYDYGKNWTKLK